MRLLALLCVCACRAAALTLEDEDHRHLVGPYSQNASLDCATRNFTWFFAQSLLPERAPLVSVFDALRLAVDCNQTRPSAPPAPAPPFYAAGGGRVLRALPLPAAAAGAFFVDAERGNDSNSGSEAAPFATVARALAATRAGGARPPGAAACVVLREGTHGLGGATQVLTAADSGLVVTGAAGEGEAWVSGGVQLPALAWKAFNTTGANVWVADVPAGLVASMPGLNTGAPLLRMRRAQFPNFDFEVERK